MPMPFALRVSLTALAALVASCTAQPAPANGLGDVGPGGTSQTHPHGVMPVVAQPATSAPSAEPPDWATETPELESIYRWAAANRAVLQYIPCSCGCETSGHKDNWECFVQREPSPGQYVWDNHAAGCWSCQEIAIVTRKLITAGKRLTEVRAAIDQQFGPFSMVTKRPPAGS